MDQPRPNFVIEVDPAKMSGEPCLGSSRLPVECLFRFGIVGFKENYPHVTDEEIEAVLAETNMALKEHCRRQMRERDRPRSTAGVDEANKRSVAKM